MVEVVASFNERLEIALSESGMRAVDLANSLGISQSTISQYRSGYSTPKKDRMLEIANILNVNPSWLLGFNAPKRIDDEIIEDSIILKTAKKHFDDERSANIFNQMYFDNFAKKYLNEKTMNLIKAYLKADEGIQHSIDILLNLDSCNCEMGESYHSENVS